MTSMEPEASETPSKHEEDGMRVPSLEFLASHGGPFFEFQRRLKLLSDGSLNVGKRALLFVGLAWGVPLILSGLSRGYGSFLSDPGAWAKFLVAVGAFVLAEQQVERGLRIKLQQFVRAPLIDPDSWPAAATALSRAVRQRDSRVVEIGCLAVCLLVSIVTFASLDPSQVSQWAVKGVGEQPGLTLAGWWSLLVSTPLVVFLLLRGLWRHLVWARLLRTIAGLKLRLVSTHPDGKGGLSFLADYPNAYMLFVFGVSSVMAAVLTKHLFLETLTVAAFSSILAGWLIVVIGLFAYPLAAFSKPLATLKEQTLLALGAQATSFQRAAERKAIGSNIMATNGNEETESVGTVDVSKQFEITRKLSSVLVSRSAALPVAAAALLPFAVVGVTKLPYKEVFSVLKKLLLL
ncbi:hypothetical protein JNB88_28735 [Rhizobium cauense]|uniref:hypothetical protein n=1 Tax=Rhizobium cauense TaxID=1166683 RepID=UPI001C6EB6D2|nr:hypothetical protein [Rhizobium cauense]MBW9117614.1 hypothetical protein [Rhizobium cauense]